MHKILLLLLTISVGVSEFCLAADDYSVPLTEWLQPDLQGVWNFSSEVPMQRPEQFGERQFLNDEEIAAAAAPLLRIGEPETIRKSASGIEAFYNDSIWLENLNSDDNVRTSHIVYPLNGRIPALVNGIEHQPGGVRLAAGQRPVRFLVGGISRDGPEDRGLSERCIVGFNAGPPLVPGVYNNNLQIVQNNDHVVLLTEMVHDARIVKLEERPFLDDKMEFWSGDSRGHWEGNSLIVVTRNFNGLTQSLDGYGSSKNKILTERFTRTGPNSLDYEFTIEDPSTFTEALTAIVPMTKTESQLYEYACHEGNYGMGNMLRAARKREANEVSDRVADIFR
jgi:hypothetical protein